MHLLWGGCVWSTKRHEYIVAASSPQLDTRSTHNVVERNSLCEEDDVRDSAFWTFQH